MGFPTNAQVIRRKDSEPWYINFPSAVVQAMEFQRREIVEWFILDKPQLVLRRHSLPASTAKRTNHGRDGCPPGRPSSILRSRLFPTADLRPGSLSRPARSHPSGAAYRAGAALLLRLAV